MTEAIEKILVELSKYVKVNMPIEPDIIERLERYASNFSDEQRVLLCRAFVLGYAKGYFEGHNKCSKQVADIFDTHYPDGFAYMTMP